MSTNTTPTPPHRSSGSATLVLLLVAAAGGIYAGMRWHSTLERWLLPAANAEVAKSDNKTLQGKGQLWTCGMHPQFIQDHAGDCPICHMKLTPFSSGDTSTRADAGTVAIDPVIVQNMGVRTVEVIEGQLDQIVRVNAIITEAESGHRDVTLRVSGWIEKLYADTEGMEVNAGDPLFDLYSPELTLAIEELVSARAAATGADRDTGNHSVTLSTSLVTAAENRLLALGLSPTQIHNLSSVEHAPRIVTISSPISGHITDKMETYEGTAVTAGQRVFRLAQRTTMWIEGRVPERDIGQVRLGQKTRARVDAYPGRTFDGEVIFVYPHFDETTRTATVRMAISNHDLALHQGMYARIEIDVGNADRIVLVPLESIIDSGESQIVLISTGKGRFEPRAVVVGRRGTNGLVQIISGVKPGEQIVVSGQFLIDSESRLREAISKFLLQKSSSNAALPPTLPATPPTPTIIMAAPERADAIVAAYLPLAESLGATQTTDTPLKLEQLIVALQTLHKDVKIQEGRVLVEKSMSAAKALNGQPLNTQRELFKKLSATIIALVDAIPPSPSVATALYVVNCPMAEADWLQRTTDIANPYYAEEMKECGAVVRSIGDTKGAR